MIMTWPFIAATMLALLAGLSLIIRIETRPPPEVSRHEVYNALKPLVDAGGVIEEGDPHLQRYAEELWLARRARLVRPRDPYTADIILTDEGWQAMEKWS